LSPDTSASFPQPPGRRLRVTGRSGERCPKAAPTRAWGPRSCLLMRASRPTAQPELRAALSPAEPDVTRRLDAGPGAARRSL